MKPGAFAPGIFFCVFSPGVFVSFVLGLRVFLRDILSGIIRRLILDGDIKGGRKGEENT